MQRASLAVLIAGLALPVSADDWGRGGPESSWERYQQSREIVDRHLRELREKELLRLQRQQEYLQRKAYYERKRELREQR